MFGAHLSASLLQVSAFSAERWRWALFVLTLTVVLATIGLTALGVFFFRRRTSNPVLLYFSIFVLFYAIRMLVREGPLVIAFQIPPLYAFHIERFITYTIVIPSLLVFFQDVDPQRKTFFRIMLWIQVAFATVAIPADLLRIAPNQFDTANSILVLLFWATLIVFLFFVRPPGRLPRDLRVVAVGLSIFGIFVLHANLVGLKIIPGQNLEPIGFLAFVCSLGYLVAHRISNQEESLRSIQKELEIAQQIQNSILPREVPQFPGFEIAARYLPMSAVAGDFYDFVVLEGHQLGILIADVTGHGVPAALIASMLKVAFAGQVANAHDPARVLTGLNQALCGKFEAHFVTAAYLFVDLEAKVARYAGAGHPPILATNPSNPGARVIEQNGFFLGMFPEATYFSLELPLQPGDRFVLYTDGLPETTNAEGKEYGLKRCQQFLASHPNHSAAILADSLLYDINCWSSRGASHVQEDDMTLIVLDLHPQT